MPPLSTVLYCLFETTVKPFLEAIFEAIIEVTLNICPNYIILIPSILYAYTCIFVGIDDWCLCRYAICNVNLNGGAHTMLTQNIETMPIKQYLFIPANDFT